MSQAGRDAEAIAPKQGGKKHAALVVGERDFPTIHRKGSGGILSQVENLARFNDGTTKTLISRGGSTGGCKACSTRGVEDVADVSLLENDSFRSDAGLKWC